jgi:hypothetical protein
MEPSGSTPAVDPSSHGSTLTSRRADGRRHRDACAVRPIMTQKRFR